MRMIVSNPSPFAMVRDTGNAMPKARAQSVLDEKKPSRERGIKREMQTSSHSSRPNGGFTALQSTREFDLWLQRELGRLHGDVLHEPVPDKLLRIIENGIAPRD